MTNKTRFTRPLSLVAVAGLALAAACADGDAVVQPATGSPGDELFARYVAVGNSITAGFQSSGINDSTQLRSYPVYLAQQAGAPFGVPLLNRPGCPPPLAAPFSTARVGVPGQPPATAATCAFRRAPVPEVVQNLAVPGAVIASATNLAPAANALTTFILGGRTQVQAMQAAQPTLVSAWLGNNDVLGAALQGSTALLTPVANFTASLDALAAAIQQTDARDAILIGAVDPVVVPALQPGAFAWFIKQNPQTAPLLPNPVNANCAPLDPTGAPNPMAFNQVSLLIVGQTVPGTNQPIEINCSPEAPFVLSPAESQAISERVAAFNQLIQQRAAQNGWIYVNPNALLQPFLADPSAIRKCQGLPAALQTGNPAAIQQAILTTCPSPDPAQGFGNLMSFDGVHPSARAHRIVTNALVNAINAKHGLSIPTVAVN
jgi:lysophospholipase L1-like esterase